MKRRFAPLAVAAAVSAGALVACVDLFHATEYDTLCTVSPDAPGCDEAGGPVVDAATEKKPDATVVRPHPDFCGWTSEEALVQAKRACAWLGACEGPVAPLTAGGDSALGICLFRAQLAFDCKATPTLRPRGAVDDLWSCLVTAESCRDVHTCLFPVQDQPCQVVKATACSKATQSEKVRIECLPTNTDGKPAGVEPCVLRGQTCADEEDKNARCTGTGGLSCTGAKCSGTNAVHCPDGGADLGFDCAGYGAGACVVSSAGPSCTPGAGAAACGAETAPACDDDVVTACVDGKETRVDCKALSLTCDVTGVPAHDLAAACVDTTGGCNVPDDCSGSLLTTCSRGKAYSIDCGSLGLGKCTKNADAVPSCGPPK